MSKEEVSAGVGQSVAEKLRREKLLAFTRLLVNSEGQRLEEAMNEFSRATGNTLQKIEEYWKVVSNNNRGPVYERHGLIKVRRMFKKWLEGGLK